MARPQQHLVRSIYLLELNPSFLDSVCARDSNTPNPQPLNSFCPISRFTVWPLPTARPLAMKANPSAWLGAIPSPQPTLQLRPSRHRRGGAPSDNPGPPPTRWPRSQLRPTEREDQTSLATTPKRY